MANCLVCLNATWYNGPRKNNDENETLPYLGKGKNTKAHQQQQREVKLGRPMEHILYKDITLGIACPMANERDNAIAFVDAVMSVCRPMGFRKIHFFTIFDRVCTDGTYEMLLEHAAKVPELRVVFAPENRSVVDAYVRGYREAMAAECDWILEIDAGFSHRPEDIPQFFQTMVQGYDCVFGSRFCPGAQYRETSLKRIILSRGGTWLSNRLLGTRLHDMASGFELFSRQAMSKILAKGIHSRGPFFQTEIRTYAHALKIIEVPIQYGAASHHINSKAIKDAFANLWRLFQLRIKGDLFTGMDDG